MRKPKEALLCLAAATLAAVLTFALPTSAFSSARPDATGPTRAARCSQFDGQACATTGTTFRCYHVFPTEPGICFCTAAHTWACG